MNAEYIKPVRMLILWLAIQIEFFSLAFKFFSILNFHLFDNTGTYRSD